MLLVHLGLKLGDLLPGFREGLRLKLGVLGQPRHLLGQCFARLVELLLLSLERFLTQGLTAGAVKG